jgi:hypothetical protein
MKLPTGLFFLAAWCLPFGALAITDSLTVFMWVVGPKREAYRVYYKGTRVLSTSRGGGYLGSFHLPDRSAFGSAANTASPTTPCRLRLRLAWTCWRLGSCQANPRSAESEVFPYLFNNTRHSGHCGYRLVACGGSLPGC